MGIEHAMNNSRFVSKNASSYRLTNSNTSNNVLAVNSLLVFFLFINLVSCLNSISKSATLDLYCIAKGLRFSKFKNCLLLGKKRMNSSEQFHTLLRKSFIKFLQCFVKYRIKCRCSYQRAFSVSLGLLKTNCFCDNRLSNTWRYFSSSFSTDNFSCWFQRYVVLFTNILCFI